MNHVLAGLHKETTKYQVSVLLFLPKVREGADSIDHIALAKQGDNHAIKSRRTGYVTKL